MVRRRLSLAFRVDKHPARQIEGADVGEELVEVGVGHIAVSDVLVLGVPNEHVVSSIPPGEVGSETHFSFHVETANASFEKHALRDLQRVSQGLGHELLEQFVHVHQESGGAHPSGWAEVQAAGVTPEYAKMRNVQMEQGEFINNVHLRNSALVAVIDKSMAERMFTTRNPIGQPVRVNGRLFTIIGVTDDPGLSFFGGGGETVLIPITTALNRLAEPSPFRDQAAIDTIYAEAVSPDAVDDAKEEIRVILRLRHRLTGRDDFDIETLQELIESLNQIIAVFVLFLGTVAGISLLVGGIGVMNIMLVSVTERTREIGIRKAMGAKRRDVLFQFVAEAILLTIGGGAIGLLLSLALTPPINLLVAFIVTEGDPSSATAPPGVGFDPGIATVALLVSATIGLCAGIYPAMRASRMHPIEALRYE